MVTPGIDSCITRYFLEKEIWRDIGEHTLGTNLMNVMFATKDFRGQATLLPTNEHTLGTNLMNVMFATKYFPTQAT
jgi:hypothetical protein